MSRSVVVTGLGFITSIGLGITEVTTSLRAGRTGIVPYDFCGNPRIAVKVAGPVPGFNVDSPSWRDWTWPKRYEIPRETLRGLAPHGVYAFCAIEQALADATLTPAEVVDGKT